MSADLPGTIIARTGSKPLGQDSSVDDTRRIHPNEGVDGLADGHNRRGWYGRRYCGEEATRLSVKQVD
jgi:hypothetical protein